MPHRDLLCGRLGVIESKILDALENGKSNFALNLRRQAWVNAGIFPPTKSQLVYFANSYRTAILETDLLAIWPPKIQDAHDNLISKYAINVPQIDMAVLDVFSLGARIEPDRIWISKLAGKRVLIVHPFARSFENQYSKLKQLHRIPIIPFFEATFTLPPMTQGLNMLSGTYTTNLTVYLENLGEIISQGGFDYALVAAGAYGLPICRFLKQKNITTIYIGGALQLIFGVSGSRWKNRSDLDMFRTSHWLDHPLENPPRGAKYIEGKTYW